MVQLGLLTRTVSFAGISRVLLGRSVIGVLITVCRLTLVEFVARHLGSGKLSLSCGLRTWTVMLTTAWVVLL